MLVARRLRLSSGRFTAPTSLLIPKRGGSRLLWVSSFHQRGRSSAAHASSQLPKAQEGRKQVSRDERKALVESYICKYRSINDGKFPTVSAAQHEVGGSYYVVRQLLQEIEYRYKTSSSDMKNEKLVEQRKPSIDSKAAGSELTVDGKIKEQSEKIVIDDVLVDSTVQNVDLEILQEIEYGHKTSSSNMKNEKLVEQRKPSIISKAAGSELTVDSKIKEQSEKTVIDDVLFDSTVQNVELETSKPTSSIGGVLHRKTLDIKTEDDSSRDLSIQSPVVYDEEAEGVSKKPVGKNKQRKEKKQFIKDSTVDDKTQNVETFRENSNVSDAAKSTKGTKRKAGENLSKLSRKVECAIEKEASLEGTLDGGDLHKDNSENFRDTAIVLKEKSSSSSFWGSIKSLAAGVIKIWSSNK